jgi:hypothetical protein
VIGRSVRRLYFYEPATGRIRGLTPQLETAAAEVNWSAGPSLAVFSPATLAITFTLIRSGVGSHSRAHPNRLAPAQPFQRIPFRLRPAASDSDATSFLNWPILLRLM